MARERFGEVAVRLGFVTPEQVGEALERQSRMQAEGESRLIGLVMLDMGLLGNFQLINVLKEMEGQAVP